MGTKICTKCGEEKAMSEFRKNKSKKSGFSSHCRDCIKVYDSKNKDYLLEKRKIVDKKYRVNNKHKVINYYQQNKDYIKTELRPKYKKNNKKRMRYHAEILSDYYIISTLSQMGLDRNIIRTNPNIIQVKRFELKLVRYVKQNKK